MCAVMLPPMFLELVPHGVRLFPRAVLLISGSPRTILVPLVRAGQVRRIDWYWWARSVLSLDEAA